MGLFLYLAHATYGFTNGIVSLTYFGPGRIRNTLLVAIVLSTTFVIRRERVCCENLENKTDLRGRDSRCCAF
jgi:hypothetical protein